MRHRQLRQLVAATAVLVVVGGSFVLGRWSADITVSRSDTSVPDPEPAPSARPRLADAAATASRDGSEAADDGSHDEPGESEPAVTNETSEEPASLSSLNISAEQVWTAGLGGVGDKACPPRVDRGTWSVTTEMLNVKCWEGQRPHSAPRRRLYYAIGFGGEVELLLVHLHEIYPAADVIVIVEFGITHAHHKKPSMWRQHKKMFKPFLQKVRYWFFDEEDLRSVGSACQRVPEPAYLAGCERGHLTSWDLVHLMYRLPAIGLSDAADGDVVIVNGDTDEVVHRRSLLAFRMCPTLPSENGRNLPLHFADLWYNFNCLSRPHRVQVRSAWVWRASDWPMLWQWFASKNVTDRWPWEPRALRTVAAALRLPESERLDEQYQPVTPCVCFDSAIPRHILRRDWHLQRFSGRKQGPGAKRGSLVGGVGGPLMRQTLRQGVKHVWVGRFGVPPRMAGRNWTCAACASRQMANVSRLISPGCAPRVSKGKPPSGYTGKGSWPKRASRTPAPQKGPGKGISLGRRKLLQANVSVPARPAGTRPGRNMPPRRRGARCVYRVERQYEAPDMNLSLSHNRDRRMYYESAGSGGWSEIRRVLLPWQSPAAAGGGWHLSYFGGASAVVAHNIRKAHRKSARISEATAAAAEANCSPLWKSASLVTLLSNGSKVSAPRRMHPLPPLRTESGRLPPADEGLLPWLVATNYRHYSCRGWLRDYGGV